MIALGCLLLLVLPIVGLIIGGLIGGGEAALWAAGAGFIVAAAVCGVMAFALVKAGQSR